MRLIDGDAFDRVLADAQDECRKTGGNFRYGVLNNVRGNLAKMPTVGGWISVKDRLPDKCGKYIIRDKMDVTIALLIDKEKGLWQWSDSDFYGRGGITHWMEIPELPEVSE